MSDNAIIHVRVRVTNPEIISLPDFDSSVESEVDYGAAPQYGWDNAVDVEEAKRMCRDMAGGPLNNNKGKSVVFDLAMRLRAQGISKSVAADLIHRYCTSPLSKVDVSVQCHDAYRAAVIAPGVMSYARNTLVAGDPDSAWPEGDEEPRVWPKPLTYHKENDAKCADTFLTERPDRLLSSGGVLYSLEGNRVWRALEDRKVAAEIRRTDPTLVLSTGLILQMVRAIHLARQTDALPFDWIDKPEGAPEPNDLVLASNGILNVRTGDLIGHTGRYFATGLPDWAYDPEATCPLWLEKLGEWLHPSFHPALQEFMGYLLTPDTSAQMFLAMIGAKRGGKSTITGIMESLVGIEHHASPTLQSLSGDFGLEALIDKRLAIIPDAHDTDVSRRAAAIQHIKSITGNDRITVNRKNKTELPSIKIPARIVLVANKHPKFIDESGALADREIVLVFETSFSKVRDVALGSKLRAELPGIANWALEGLHRLRANGNRFTIGERGRKAQRELAESQSPALRFANESLIVTGDKTDAVPLAVVFEAYEHWAYSIEGMSGRERRNRSDLKTDLLAALAERGVRYDAKMAKRWRDLKADEWKHGNGVVRRHWFTGVRLRPGLVPMDD